MSDLVGNPEDRFSHNEAHLFPNVVAWLEVRPLCMQAALTLELGHVDSKRTSCQLLSKEWSLNTDKLHLGDLPWNRR